MKSEWTREKPWDVNKQSWRRERMWPAEVTALQPRFSSSFECVPGPEWPASYPHTHRHTHTHTQRAKMCDRGRGKRSEAFICCFALNRLLVRQGTPKGSREKACARLRVWVSEWVSLRACVCVFCTCCLAAFFCQEVSNSSCVNSGLAPSITRNTSCQNKSQEFIKIAWLHSIKYWVLHVKILNYNWITLFSLLKHFFPPLKKKSCGDGLAF